MTDRTDRVISRTAIVANATLALAFAVVTLTVAWPRVASAIGIRWAAPKSAAYRVNDRIDVPPDWYQSSGYTLVLFARSSCSACQAAHPFLQKLVGSLEGGIRRLRPLDFTTRFDIGHGKLVASGHVHSPPGIRASGVFDYAVEMRTPADVLDVAAWKRIDFDEALLGGVVAAPELSTAP